jgi:hypothetical protein
MPNSSREREIKIGRAKSKREEDKEKGECPYLEMKIFLKFFHEKIKKNNICNPGNKRKKNIACVDSPE